MSDTNWCTFCDRAVNSLSNSIYCSKECYQQDALTHNPVLMAYVEEQQRIQNQQNIIAIVHSSLDPIMISLPQKRSRRNSCSSICSEDLVTMHLDMIPPSSPIERIEPIQLMSHPLRPIANKSTTNSPPFLSSSTSAASSPASSHSDLMLGTSINFAYELPICEKLSSIQATATHHHPSVYNNHSLPH